MNVIADYISREGEKVGEGNNAELSLEQWTQFLAAHENELPTPGDEWQLNEGETAVGLDTAMLDPSLRLSNDEDSSATFEAEAGMTNPLKESKPDVSDLRNSISDNV